MLKRIGWFSLAALVEKIVGLIIVAVLVRELPKADYANYGLLLLSIALFAQVLDFGQNSWIRLVYARSMLAMPDALRRSLWLVLKVSPISIFGILYAYNLYGDAYYSILFLIGLLSVFAGNLTSGLLVTSKLAKDYFKISFIKSSADISGFFALYYLVGFDLVTSRVISIWIASSVGGILALFALRLLPKARIHIADSVPDPVSYGFPLLLTGLSVTGVAFAERNILDLYASGELVADLFVALTLISPILVLNDLIGKAYTTEFFQKMDARENSWIAKNQRAAIYTNLAMCGIFSLTLPQIAVLYSGEKYDTESFRVLVQVLCFYPFFKLLYQFFGRYYLYFELQKLLSLVTVFVACTYLILLFYIASDISHLYFSIVHVSSIAVTAFTVRAILYLKFRF